MAWVLVAIIAVLVLVVIGIYNRLVGLRQGVRQGVADIDAQLRQRHDLIPNLVETVKGYAGHEKGTLESVIQMRNAAMSATFCRLPFEYARPFLRGSNWNTSHRRCFSAA